jgi:hypothetical protein
LLLFFFWKINHYNDRLSRTPSFQLLFFFIKKNIIMIGTLALRHKLLQLQRSNLFEINKQRSYGLFISSSSSHTQTHIIMIGTLASFRLHL